MCAKIFCTTRASFWRRVCANTGRQEGAGADYRVYTLNGKQKFWFGAEAVFLAAGGAYFFYRSFYPCLLIPFVVKLFWNWKRKMLCQRRKDGLRQQFKDMILSVSAGLQAGYSPENAFSQSEKDLLLLYGKDSDICREAGNIKHLLENNVTLENILLEFAERSGVEEIVNFASVFSAGKRSGGDFREIIQSSVGIISRNIDTTREIKTLIHGRVMEHRIMCVIPFFIISYISLTSPGYFTPLYYNLYGVCVMSLCLFLYILSVIISSRIVRIEV